MKKKRLSTDKGWSRFSAVWRYLPANVHTSGRGVNGSLLKHFLSLEK
jgi:hypothetical protein